MPSQDHEDISALWKSNGSEDVTRKIIRKNTKITDYMKINHLDGYRPAIPVGIPELIELFFKGKLTRIDPKTGEQKDTLLGASMAFNRLVPSKRTYFADRTNLKPRLEKFIRSSKTGTYGIQQLTDEAREIKSKLDICYLDNTGSAFYLADIVAKVTYMLKLDAKIPPSSAPQKVYDFIHKLMHKAILTAHGENPQTIVVNTSEKLKELSEVLTEYKGPLVLDIETGGLDPYTSAMVGIGISTDASVGYYIPMTLPPGTYKTTFSSSEDAEITLICKASEISKFVKAYIAPRKVVAHNSKFEYQFFKTTFGVELDIFQDTMVGEYIMDCRLKGRFNLGASVKERFPLMEEWKESKEFFKNIINLPIQRVATYCAKDCCNEYLLMMAQVETLYTHYNYITNQVDVPFCAILGDAELHGFTLNKEYLKQLNVNLSAQVEDLGDKIRKKLGNINIDSSGQLADAIFNRLKYTPTVLTPGGAPSVNSAALKALAASTEEEVFQQLLDRRALKKIAITYTTSFVKKINPVTGNVHPGFMNTNTETGRLACVNPNFQNLPKNASDLIRKAIVAPDGSTLIFSDYSGQEVTILAAASMDEGLLRAYNPCYKCPHTHDKHKCPKITHSIGTPDYCRPIGIHDLVTSKVYKDQVGDCPVWEISKYHKKLRSISKCLTFLLVYGGSEMTLAQRTGVTIDEAKKIFREYYEAFPGIKTWIKSMYEFALKNGYSQDFLGRRRYYDILDPETEYGSDASPFTKKPFVSDDLRVRNLKYGKDYYKKVMGALRRSQNHPIQGTAAEMTKEGSLFTKKRFDTLDFRASIIGFVHDEIISTCPKNKDQILQTVEQIRLGMTDDIPLISKYGFPPMLTMDVGISAGDNWGQAMKVEEYLDTF